MAQRQSNRPPRAQGYSSPKRKSQGGGMGVPPAKKDDNMWTGPAADDGVTGAKGRLGSDISPADNPLTAWSGILDFDIDLGGDVIPGGDDLLNWEEELSQTDNENKTPGGEEGGGYVDDETASGEIYGASQGALNIQTPQIDLGISTPAIGSKGDLQRMLQSYQGRSKLIQGAQRQKAIYTIDRFDGGLNLNKSARDLAYWEACQMDELSPSKVGRLTRLGDFKQLSLDVSSAVAANPFDAEGYGLYFCRLTNDLASPNYGGAPSEICCYQDSDDINIIDITNSNSVKTDVVTNNDSDFKPVFHNDSKRVYVSDASLTDHSSSTNKNSQMFGFVNEKYFPTAIGTYKTTFDNDDSALTSQDLIQSPPVKGEGTGQILVTTASGSSPWGGGIYIEIDFANTVTSSGELGWGGESQGDAYYYRFYASFLYDESAETSMTEVGVSSGVFNSGATSTTTSDGIRALQIQNIRVDWDDMDGTFPRVHGTRIYYKKYTDSNATISINEEPYLLAELDFRYGLKISEEGATWNLFEDEDTTHIPILNANGTNNISVLSPPVSMTWYSLNLVHEHEIKKDLQWKCVTVGKGIAYIGNVKYDGIQYNQTMLFSLNGESEVGSIRSSLGVFPVESNRIDIEAPGGEITALNWYADRLLQFRKNCLYIVNVQDPLAPFIEAKYQGMGVAGPWAVTETPLGLAWVNGQGAYAYNGETAKARSLTIGRIDTEEWQAGTLQDVITTATRSTTTVTYTTDSAHQLTSGDVVSIAGLTRFNTADLASQVVTVTGATTFTMTLTSGAGGNLTSQTGTLTCLSPHDKTKIGYDDRAKMLIVANFSKNATNGYHFAYSLVTDAWCTWNQNADTYTTKTNFAVDNNGYLVGAVDNSTNINVRRWDTVPGAAVAVDYITKDIDFGTPNLDKRLYTLYISYTGGTGQTGLLLYFRVNGKEGSDLANGWYQLETIQDYTDPYFTTNSTAWNDSSGTPITGDPTINISTGLNSTSIGESQKLAKINLRNLGTTDTVDDTDTGDTTLPKDYLKFARSIQFRLKGTASSTFEINDISLVFKEKRIK